MVIAGHASAFTYFVTKSGSDANSCTAAKTLATAKLTIGSGGGCLAAGDTLEVYAGTYAESVDNVLPSGTDWTAPVTMLVHPGDVVTIQPPAASLFGIHSSTSSYVVVSGLDPAHPTNRNLIVDGAVSGTGSNTGIKLDASGGAPYAHHWKFYNVDVHDWYYEGVLTTDTSTQPVGWFEFWNIRSHANGHRANLDHGMYLASNNSLVQGSEFDHNYAYGIQVGNSNWAAVTDTLGSSNAFVLGNKVHDNGHGIVMETGTFGASVVNNLIYDNQSVGGGTSYNPSQAWNAQGLNTSDPSQTTRYGMQDDFNTFGNLWAYNTCANSGTNGLYFGTQSNNATAINNIVCGSTVQTTVLSTNSSLQANLVQTSCTSPSIFSNYAGKDFTLASGSAAIGIGIQNPIPTPDYQGVARVYGQPRDVGAYTSINSGQGRAYAQ